MKPTLRSAEDLGEVFQAHQAELVRLAAFILGDRGTGEDVVQDVFVRMHQRGYPMDGDLLPYLRAAVVAGVTKEGPRSSVNGPVVTTVGGVTHRARVVFYDPQMDIAVLYVPGLNSTPLRFSARAKPDDDAVVAGYPEDHPFTAVPARVGQTETISIANIYHTRQVDRQVYEIRAAVEGGNSGSPVIAPDGDVYGVVFAVDANTPGTGFALTAAEVKADASAGANATVPVSTQDCD